MKKILLSAAAVLMAFSASALNPTAKMAINLFSATNATDNVSLVEEPSFSSAKEEFESNKIIMTESASNVNIYALQEAWEDPKASIVMTNNLVGTKIVVVTNTTETSYKLTFTNVAGRTLKLLDKHLKVATDIIDNGEYAFTVASAGRQTIADRFEIVETYTPSDYAFLCHFDDRLIIYDNPYTGNIVITDVTGAEVKSVAPTATPQTIDLSDLAAGNYNVILGGGQKELVINVK